MQNIGGLEMEKVTFTPNEILVVQCEKCIEEERLRAFRDYLQMQMQEGIIMIPPGFSYSILKSNIAIIECGGKSDARKQD